MVEGTAVIILTVYESFIRMMLRGKVPSSAYVCVHIDLCMYICIRSPSRSARRSSFLYLVSRDQRDDQANPDQANPDPNPGKENPQPLVSLSPCIFYRALIKSIEVDNEESVWQIPAALEGKEC